jgi:hypothetical protein
MTARHLLTDPDSLINLPLAYTDAIWYALLLLGSLSLCILVAGTGTAVMLLIVSLLLDEGGRVLVSGVI